MITIFLSIKDKVLAKLMVIKDLPSPEISEVIQITLEFFSEAKKLKLVLTERIDSAKTDLGFSKDNTCLLLLSNLVGNFLTTPIIGELLKLSTVSLS